MRNVKVSCLFAERNREGEVILQLRRVASLLATAWHRRAMTSGVYAQCLIRGVICSIPNEPDFLSADTVPSRKLAPRWATRLGRGRTGVQNWRRSSSRMRPEMGMKYEIRWNPNFSQWVCL